MFRRLSAFALALLLAGCAATPAPESAAATATPSPSAALTPTPGRCPTYEEAMAAAAGPGETGEGAYTDADACLQNAYALAAALYAKDASAAAAACGRALDDAPNENAGAADLFPFAESDRADGGRLRLHGRRGGGTALAANHGRRPWRDAAARRCDHIRRRIRRRLLHRRQLRAGADPAGAVSAAAGRAWQAVTSFRNWVHRRRLAGRGRPAAGRGGLLSDELRSRARRHGGGDRRPGRPTGWPSRHRMPSAAGSMLLTARAKRPSAASGMAAYTTPKPIPSPWPPAPATPTATGG